MTTVAVLGTGIMGGPMAANLARAGLSVRVWNRTRAKAEVIAGAAVAETPADAVRGADVVVTSLFDTAAVTSVIEATEGAWTPDAVWLQTSTVGVSGTTSLAALATRLGVAFVDAPVLGTKQPAEAGTLVVLAGGDRALAARLAPVLDAISSRTVWAGGVGAGTALKLACNAWVLTTVDGVAQSLALARSLGVDPQLFLDAVGGGAVDSPYVQLKGGAMLNGGFAPPSFPATGGAKDLGLIAEAAPDLTLIAAVRAHFDAVVAQGFGDEDLAAVFRAY